MLQCYGLHTLTETYQKMRPTFAAAHDDLMRVMFGLQSKLKTDTNGTIVDLSSRDGFFDWYWQSTEAERLRLITKTRIRLPFRHGIFGFVNNAGDDDRWETGLAILFDSPDHRVISCAVMFEHEEITQVERARVIFELHLNADGFFERMKIPPERVGVDDEIEHDCLFMSGAIGCALAMFHVKNIVLVPHSFPRHLRRQQKRDEPDAGDGPTVYHTIAVLPFSKNAERNSSTRIDSRGATPVPLHNVRGNFATYSAEHPMFGLYEGTFWREEHEAGNRRAGLVRKNYEIDTEN